MGNAIVAAIKGLTYPETTSDAAPILRRPRNFQWYWKAGVDPWTNSSDEWVNYCDIDNEIIEGAFTTKKGEIEIDGDYVIDFKNQVQYRKFDILKQRPMKRIQFGSTRRSTHLREERFSSSLNLVSSRTDTDRTTPNESLFGTDMVESSYFYPDFPMTYFTEGIKDHNTVTVADIVEEAAVGILNEGAKNGNTKKAEWLIERLRDIKDFGVDYGIYDELPDVIGQTCVHLYTMDGFWQAKLNSVLRAFNLPHAVTTRENLKTFGPFSFLLHSYLRGHPTTSVETVYRGVNLTDDDRLKYLGKKAWYDEDYFMFTSFTSTSKDRELAEIYGNTLFIIDLNVKYKYRSSSRIDVGLPGRIQCGTDISGISYFPEEQEFLLMPGSTFKFTDHQYDNVNNKHIIYIRSYDK